MFSGFSNETVDFMWGIRFNNEREWFEAHKDAYLSSFYRPMKALGEELLSFLHQKRPKLWTSLQNNPYLSRRAAASWAGTL